MKIWLSHYSYGMLLPTEVFNSDFAISIPIELHESFSYKILPSLTHGRLEIIHNQMI